MKRGRNNHQRRRQGVNPNRALDSNGPDVRIRGTAQQIFDKYQALARDAASSGDRVKAENYLQHAEHYFRMLRAMQGPQAQQAGDGEGADMEGDQPIMEQRDRSERSDNRSDDRGEERGDDDEQPSIEAEFAEDPDFGARQQSERPAFDRQNQEARRQDRQPQDGSQQHAGNGGPNGQNGDERRPRRRRPRRQPREGGADESAAPEPATAD
jgi:hypothetical protein